MHCECNLQDLRLIPFTISQQDYANEDTLNEEAEWSTEAEERCPKSAPVSIILCISNYARNYNNLKPFAYACVRTLGHP